MDIATIIGIFFGFSVIIGSILIGTGPRTFIDIPSVAITIGGMILRYANTFFAASIPWNIFNN